MIDKAVRVLDWVAFLALAIVFTQVGWYWWAEFTKDTRHPLDLTIATYTEVLENPVPVGGKLHFRHYRTKVRDDCTVVSTRHAVDTSGRVYDIPDVAWEGGPKDVNYVDLTYDTSLLPPGEYVASAFLLYLCPGGVTYSYIQPDVRFKIGGAGE